MWDVVIAVLITLVIAVPVSALAEHQWRRPFLDQRNGKGWR